MVWNPGQSGNPGGRPKRLKTIAKEIRHILNDDPSEFVLYAIRVWKGTEQGVTTHQQRWDAMCWLKDNGWGRAPLTIEINDVQVQVNAPQIDNLSDEQLEQLVAAQAMLTGVIDV